MTDAKKTTFNRGKGEHLVEVTWDLTPEQEQRIREIVRDELANAREEIAAKVIAQLQKQARTRSQ